MSITIGKLAEAANVGIETIRFYQRKGLLDEPPRSQGGRRYGASDVRRLTFIRQAKAAGFTLEEINKLIRLDAGEDREEARALAYLRLTALDEKIAELEEARSSLRRLIDRCADGKEGPCPILASFGL